MKVRFNTNLGSRDAQALNLDFAKCTKDSVHEFDSETVERLRKCGNPKTGAPNIVGEVVDAPRSAAKFAESVEADPKKK